MTKPRNNGRPQSEQVRRSEGDQRERQHFFGHQRTREDSERRAAQAAEQRRDGGRPADQNSERTRERQRRPDGSSSHGRPRARDGAASPSPSAGAAVAAMGARAFGVRPPEVITGSVTQESHGGMTVHTVNRGHDYLDGQRRSSEPGATGAYGERTATSGRMLDAASGPRAPRTVLHIANAHYHGHGGDLPDVARGSAANGRVTRALNQTFGSQNVTTVRDATATQMRDAMQEAVRRTAATADRSHGTPQLVIAYDGHGTATGLQGTDGRELSTQDLMAIARTGQEHGVNVVLVLDACSQAGAAVAADRMAQEYLQRQLAEAPLSESGRRSAEGSLQRARDLTGIAHSLSAGSEAMQSVSDKRPNSLESLQRRLDAADALERASATARFHAQDPLLAAQLAAAAEAVEQNVAEGGPVEAAEEIVDAAVDLVLEMAAEAQEYADMILYLEGSAGAGSDVKPGTPALKPGEGGAPVSAEDVLQRWGDHVAEGLSGGRGPLSTAQATALLIAPAAVRSRALVQVDNTTLRRVARNLDRIASVDRAQSGNARQALGVRRAVAAELFARGMSMPGPSAARPPGPVRERPAVVAPVAAPAPANGAAPRPVRERAAAANGDGGRRVDPVAVGAAAAAVGAVAGTVAGVAEARAQRAAAAGPRPITQDAAARLFGLRTDMHFTPDPRLYQLEWEAAGGKGDAAQQARWGFQTRDGHVRVSAEGGQAAQLPAEPARRGQVGFADLEAVRRARSERATPLSNQAVREVWQRIESGQLSRDGIQIVSERLMQAEWHNASGLSSRPLGFERRDGRLVLVASEEARTRMQQPDGPQHGLRFEELRLGEQRAPEAGAPTRPATNVRDGAMSTAQLVVPMALNLWEQHQLEQRSHREGVALSPRLAEGTAMRVARAANGDIHVGVDDGDLHQDVGVLRRRLAEQSAAAGPHFTVTWAVVQPHAREGTPERMAQDVTGRGIKSVAVTYDRGADGRWTPRVPAGGRRDADGSVWFGPDAWNRRVPDLNRILSSDGEAGSELAPPSDDAAAGMA